MESSRAQPQWVAPFLAALGTGVSLKEAAEAAGVHHTTPYSRLERDPGFREAWEAKRPLPNVRGLSNRQSNEGVRLSEGVHLKPLLRLQGTKYLAFGEVRMRDEKGNLLIEGDNGEAYHVQARHAWGKGAVGQKGHVRAYQGKAGGTCIFVAEDYRKFMEREKPAPVGESEREKGQKGDEMSFVERAETNNGQGSSHAAKRRDAPSQPALPSRSDVENDPEISAMRELLRLFALLTPEERQRVVSWAAARFTRV